VLVSIRMGDNVRNSVRKHEKKFVYTIFFGDLVVFGVACRIGLAPQPIQLMRPIRVLIIDDHQGILDAVVGILSGDFLITGASLDGESGFANAAALNPDIIILDISLPDISGFEVAKRLRSAGCGAKVIFLSNNRDPDVVREAFDLGASGYVLKSQIIPDLTDAIAVALKAAKFVTTGLKHEIAA
jgi:DNA-binding NarL/FixJ family response regulator